MRVLVACEFSGIVRDAFLARGCDAWSCDLEPTEAPGPHIQGNVEDILYDRWDLMIAHPPCTYLSNSGVRHLHDHITSINGKRAKVSGEKRWAAMYQGAYFFNVLKQAPIPRIAVENPIPHKYARDLIGDYTQLIQPNQFGANETKAICLWLKNLPLLVPTDNVPVYMHRIHEESPGKDRAKRRSRFFVGIAQAMAQQWGEL